jgi:putative DNA primase/helicase
LGFRSAFIIKPSSSEPTRLYLFNSGGLHEATKGYDFDRVLRALQDAEALVKTDHKKKTALARTPSGNSRFYWINPEKLTS